MQVFLEVYQYFPTGRCRCETIDVSHYTESQISEVIVKMESKYGEAAQVGCFISEGGNE